MVGFELLNLCLQVECTTTVLPEQRMLSYLPSAVDEELSAGLGREPACCFAPSYGPLPMVGFEPLNLGLHVECTTAVLPEQSQCIATYQVQ